MRGILRSACLLTVLIPATGAPVTRFRLESPLSDAIGRGVVVTVASPEGAFVATSSDDGSSVSIRVQQLTGADVTATWLIDLASTGAPLAPGLYDSTGSNPPDPSVENRLAIDGDLPPSCRPQHGRFTIRAIRWLPSSSGAVLRELAVDFTLICTGRRGDLNGSIDLWTGDSDCDGAADGTPCDDADPCSTVDECRGGSCEGAASLVCADDHADTDDVCLWHTGCTFPTAIGLWDTAGVTTVTATGPGGTGVQHVRTAGVVVLAADGSYVLPEDTPPCDAVSDPIVVYGRWSAARSGRLALDATNAQVVGDALVACDARIASATVTRTRHTARVGEACRRPRSADPATRICGRDKTRFRVRILGQRVALGVSQRYTGVRRDEGGFVPAAAARP